jgi:predicted DCC family thiol-disulfide oxidoreductase YuxK
MNATKNISPWQFAAFRIALGCYLVVHFVHLVPWAGELFSANGLLPDARANFTFGVLPNPLEHWRSTAFAQSFVAALAVLAALFTIGLGRRICAVLLWYGWACLFNRNNLISNPGIPYVGLLLLLSTLIPIGEPLSAGRRRNEQWAMPAAAFWGAWGLLVAGYSYSGAWKLFSPSWLDGTALHHLLTNPLARPAMFRDLLLALPDGALKVLTWGALGGELLALPLSLTRWGRATVWFWMLGMHLGILLVVDFADLTFGMLMIHLFTFDPDWLPARESQPRLVLFDGVCGLCERTVQFLNREDRAGILSFAPLQGETARPILVRHGLSQIPMRSLVVVETDSSEGERLFTKSTAVARALSGLGGFWRVLSWVLLAVPRPLRDTAYDFIANRRHRWFVKPSVCQIPTRTEPIRLFP